MMFYGIFFSILLLSGSITIAHAHPDALGLTVQEPDGAILYQNELGSYETKDPDSIEPFSEDWVYHNFIWVLTSVIIVTMAVVTITVYREEITPKISKIVRRA